MGEEEERHGGRSVDRKRDRNVRRRKRDESSDSSSSSDGDDRRHRRSKHRHRKSRKHSSSDSDGDESDSDDSASRKRRRSKHRSKDKEKLKSKRKEEKRKKKKEKAERHKTGPVNSWGKYGIIKEIDMWNKRPEFSAWLAEVKKVNLEALSNWEERLMFKEYMEDYNTATLPSKKYYNLDIYHRRQMIRQMKKRTRVEEVERTEFNDEEQRRQELRKEREHEKEAQLQELKQSMKSGMAQAMREQAQLREEMQYQYRLGNLEAANAIQKRLEPDPM